MKENVTLLQEINTLRSREHKIQLEIEGLTKQIDNTRRKGRGLAPEADYDMEEMTQEQMLNMEANQQIDLLADDITKMDQEIDYLLNE